MAKRGKTLYTNELVMRRVEISSFEARVAKRGETRRGYEPQIKADSSLLITGLMDEPVRDVRAIEFSVFMDESTEPGPLRPPPVGSIVKTRPQVTVVVWFPQFEFDRIWSLALHGHLRHAYLAFTAPRRNRAHVLEISFSNVPEE